MCESNNNYKIKYPHIVRVIEETKGKHQSWEE
jgi:hypothetical protein